MTLSLVLLLSGCVLRSEADWDRDGDGYERFRDCDDDDPEVGELLWYLDGDGDGVGSGQAEAVCTAPSSEHVLIGGDCDDSDPGINPGAQEVCDPDNVDEDCDGFSDDQDPDRPGANGGAFLRFRDQDEDGKGEAGQTQTFCDSEIQPGWSDSSLDCDDTNPFIYPDAAESCGDAQDMNCDGDKTCVFSLVDAQGTIAAPAGESGENFGVCLTGQDPLGFSKEKLYVGESLFDSAANVNAGRVLFFDSVENDITFDDAVLTSEGSFLQGLHGFYIEEHGPFLAVSAVGGGSTGGGVVYLGQGGKAPLVLSGEAGSEFGSSIGFGGGLKLPVMAIGAAGYSDGGGNSQGRVYLFETDGLSGGDAKEQAYATVTGEQDSDQIGKAVALLDGDGDGELDLIFGSFSHDESESNTGAYYVWMGPDSGDLNADHVTSSFYGNKGDKLGAQVAKVGDVNGDGRADAIVCAVEADWRGESQAGYCVLAYGGATGALNPDGPKIGGEASGDKLGSARAWDIAGDINDDGEDDLALSSSSAGNGDGAVYIFFGPLPDTGAVSASEASVIFDGTGSEAFGGNFEFMDFEGDAKLEFAVSARKENMVYVFALHDLLQESR